MSPENKTIDGIIQTARDQGRDQLSDIEAFQIMELVGVPLAPYQLITGDLIELRKAAAKLGYPVALKTVSKVHLHKSELGGVVTDISGPVELARAFQAMQERLVGKEIDGFLVQKMEKGSLEVIIGGNLDPVFGETVMFGLGGTWVEVLKDVSFRLAPTTVQKAKAMFSETRIYPLLGEFRGRAALPVDELAELVVAISRLLANHDIKEIDLNPMILSPGKLVCVDAKILIGKGTASEEGVVSSNPNAGLERLFNPGSVLLVGSSVLEEEVGMTSPQAFENIIHNMKRFYKGELEVLDIKAGDEATVAALCQELQTAGKQFDLAVFLVPPPQSLFLLRGLRDSIKNLIHLSSAPPQGSIEREEYLAIIREKSIRVIGSNSILGVMDTSSGLNTSFEKGLMPEPGNIAVLSQSGGVGAALLDWAVFNGIGISKFVFMGEKLDVGDVDILKTLDQDPQTKVIAIYMEGIEGGRGRDFVQTARTVVRSKPIVVLKGGKTKEAAQRARSHTASTAGTNEIFECAFQEAGVIRVGNIESLFAAAQTLLLQPPMRGRNAAVVSNVGGPAILAADALVKERFQLPRLTEASIRKLREKYPSVDPHNPIDLIADAGPERYSFVLETTLKDENIDGVLLIDMMKSTYFKPEYARVFKDIVARYPDKPVVNVVPGGEDFSAISEVLKGSGIPCFNTPKKGAKALKTLVIYHESRERVKE